MSWFRGPVLRVVVLKRPGVSYEENRTALVVSLLDMLQGMQQMDVLELSVLLGRPRRLEALAKAGAWIVLIVNDLEREQLRQLLNQIDRRTLRKLNVQAWTLHASEVWPSDFMQANAADDIAGDLD